MTETKLDAGKANPANVEIQPSDVRKLRIIAGEEILVAITAKEKGLLPS